MKKAATSAGFLIALLLSRLGATQLASLYAILLVLPFTSEKSGMLPLTVFVAATISATWHPFDLVASVVSSLTAALAIASV